MEGALDAVCYLCHWPRGAACLLTDSDIAVQVAMHALGRGGARIPALHAVAMVAGAGFGGKAASMARGELLLDPRAESSLKVCTYCEACESMHKNLIVAQEAMQAGAHSQQAHFTVADATWQLLRAPFTEQRSVVYQVLAVLCARGWATLQVALHDELLRWLLDTGSETTKQVPVHIGPECML